MSTSSDSSLCIVVSPPPTVASSPEPEAAVRPRHTRQRSNSDPLGSRNFLQVPQKGRKPVRQARNAKSTPSRAPTVVTDFGSKVAPKAVTTPPQLLSRVKSAPAKPPTVTRDSDRVQKLTGKDPAKGLEEQFSKLSIESSIESLLPRKPSRFQKFSHVDFATNPKALTEVLRIANEDFENVPPDIKVALKAAGRSVTTLTLHRDYCSKEKMKKLAHYFPKAECIQMHRCTLTPKSFSPLCRFTELTALHIDSSNVKDPMIAELARCTKLAFVHLHACDDVSVEATCDLLKEKPMSMKIEFCKNIEATRLQEALVSQQSELPLRLKSQASLDTEDVYKKRMVFQKLAQ